MKGLPLAYSKDMQEDKEQVFDAADSLALCLAAMTGMIADLAPDFDRMAAAAGAGFATATDLADWLVRRLGLITINTAIEIDLFGNVNSTHVMGKDLMNGIGGSGDFTRNAHVSIYTCPSVAKKGAISTIVPFVTHLDHSEHSVQIVVTEHGIADLRGKSPHDRAVLMIENCVLEPEVDEQLHAVLAQVADGVSALEAGEIDSGGVKIVQALNAYGEHFEHPGWQSLE
jgi:hypothetical protein